MNNNKKVSVLLTVIATAAIMAVGPVATANPVLGLGHFNGGDSDSTSQAYDRFEDCLANHEQESEAVTEKQIVHCLDLAYDGQSDESNREDNDDSDEDEADIRSDEDDDEQELKEDLAFFGDDSEDSSSNNFNDDHDSAGDEKGSTG